MKPTRPALLFWLCLLTLSLPLATGQSQEHSVRPGINRHYENPDVREWVNAFERPGREVFDQRGRILQATGVRPGMRVADIGAGTGLFTRLFARAVDPEGRVYAVDISGPFLDHIQRSSREQGLANVETVRSTPTDVRLPAQSVDLAFLSDTYHHLEYPQKIMASIHRALRPGGTLIVVDYQRIEGKSTPWVLGHVRAGREAVIREIEQAGFRFAGEEEFLKENYFLRFRKE